MVVILSPSMLLVCPSVVLLCDYVTWKANGSHLVHMDVYAGFMSILAAILSITACGVCVRGARRRTQLYLVGAAFSSGLFSVILFQLLALIYVLTMGIDSL